MLITFYWSKCFLEIKNILKFSILFKSSSWVINTLKTNEFELKLLEMRGLTQHLMKNGRENFKN